VKVVTEQETDLELEPMVETEVAKKPVKVKKPRISIYRRYRTYVSTLPKWRGRLVVVITIAAIIFGLIYLSAVIAMEPWYTNEFQEPIPRESQWIEVTGTPFEWDAYASEGQTWSQRFDFPTNEDEGKYVAEFTAYVIWVDDARTAQDTFSFVVINGEGQNEAASSGYNGQINYPARLNNTAINHVENYQGWTVNVTCQEAADGYLGPGGWITIPDDGNDFKVRFEWSYFIELNPEWQ
jgi:hypothetical protein